MLVRKEVRLEDGSVVGTFGWRDTSGLIRYYDYIADHKGYRILDQRKGYASHEEDVSNVISNEVVDVPRKRKVVKVRRARKTDPKNAPFKHFPRNPPKVENVRLSRRLGFVEADRQTDQSINEEASQKLQDPVPFQPSLPFQAPLLIENQYPRQTIQILIFIFFFF